MSKYNLYRLAAKIYLGAILIEVTKGRLCYVQSTVKTDNSTIPQTF